jgi:peroxiredoxin Q/BCP
MGTALVRRQEASNGRHARRSFIARLLMAVKRNTFIIDTDRTVLKVISSELRASIHADQALWYLRNRHQTPDRIARPPQKHHRVAPKLAQGGTS